MIGTIVKQKWNKNNLMVIELFVGGNRVSEEIASVERNSSALINLIISV